MYMLCWRQVSRNGWFEVTRAIVVVVVVVVVVVLQIKSCVQ